MKTDDYTCLPVGTRIDNGEIKVCPYCGKNALAEIVNDSTFFTHSQSVGFDENQRTVVRLDWCPNPMVPSTTSEQQ